MPSGARVGGLANRPVTWGIWRARSTGAGGGGGGWRGAPPPPGPAGGRGGGARAAPPPPPSARWWWSRCRGPPGPGRPPGGPGCWAEGWRPGPPRSPGRPRRAGPRRSDWAGWPACEASVLLVVDDAVVIIDVDDGPRARPGLVLGEQAAEQADLLVGLLGGHAGGDGDHMDAHRCPLTPAPRAAGRPGPGHRGAARGGRRGGASAGRPCRPGAGRRAGVRG